ncbi:MAG: serine hydrolase domain-containing protein [Bacteroidota bacterium]
MKTKLTCLIIALLGFMTTAFAQNDTLKTNLFKDIPAWMAEYHVPCVGVGIIENGKIKWVKNFGELQAGHAAPANSLFNIASQTKPVTAMLTLKLVEMGKWDLDEPLAHYWIDPDIAGDPYLMKLTTRLVLSHQTGFPNWRSDNGGTKLKFNFEPGTASGYSGEGFEYLRRALEAKFHQSLAVLMDSLLFKPLGMNNTCYWNDRLDTNRFAMWHDGQGKRYATSIHTFVSAADDLITTIADYCRLGIYTMGRVNENNPLYADMVRPQRRTKPGNASGLGWGIVDDLPNGDYAIQHGGSDIGVRTMAVFLPKSKSGVVVMTNGDNGGFICDRIIKRALSYGTQVLTVMNKGAATHERITIADGLIQSYTGIYAQSNGKLIKVEQAGNALKVSGDGIPTAVVYPESANQFFLDGYDVQLKFPGTNRMIVFEGGKQVLSVNRK